MPPTQSSRHLTSLQLVIRLSFTCKLQTFSGVHSTLCWKFAFYYIFLSKIYHVEVQGCQSQIFPFWNTVVVEKASPWVVFFAGVGK